MSLVQKSSDISEQATSVDDITLYYEFIKLFATDEDIAKGKKCFDEKYGDGEYENRVKLLNYANPYTDDDEEEDYEEDDEFFDEDAFHDGNAQTLIGCLIVFVNKCAYSKNGIDVDDYTLLAHLILTIDTYNVQTISRLVKLMREEYGVREKFDAVTQKVTGNKELVFKWLSN